MLMQRESVVGSQASGESLSEEERSRLHELEGVVEGTLKSFLECGRALLEVRDRALYREHYQSFEQYLLRRFGITYAQGASLIRSTMVAERLLAGPAGLGGDASLPAGVAASVLRPLQKVSPELQSACWRLARRVTEQPTGYLVSRIVRVVQGAIQEGQNGSVAVGGPKRRRKRMFFLSSVYRLGASESFCAQVIVLGLRDAEAARHCSTNCRILMSRLEAILNELERRFPEL